MTGQKNNPVNQEKETAPEKTNQGQVIVDPKTVKKKKGLPIEKKEEAPEAIKPAIKEKKEGASSRGKKFFITGFFGLLVVTDLIFSLLLDREMTQLSHLKKSLAIQEKLKEAGFNKELIERTENLEKAFLKEKGVIDFIATINRFAGEFDKLEISFKSDESIVVNEKRQLPFILEMAGSPNKMMPFLEDLFQSKFLIEVVSINAKSKDSFISNSEVRIKANLYVSDPFN